MAALPRLTVRLSCAACSLVGAHFPALVADHGTIAPEMLKLHLEYTVVIAL